jgi:arylsulfatase A-like enzyme
MLRSSGGSTSWHPHAPYRPRGGPIFGSSAARRYDAEILESDAVLGTLVDGRRGRRLREGHVARSLLADHGEEFGEHGAAFHGLTTYDHAARVPLVVAGARGFPPPATKLRCR